MKPHSPIGAGGHVECEQEAEGCWRCGEGVVCTIHHLSNVLSSHAVSTVELLWEAIGVDVCGLMMGLG